MIDFFDRLDKFMKYKGLNDNKITVSTGISNGLIGKGRLRGALSQESISKILYTYPDLDANWLLTGKGNMLKSDSPAPPIHNIYVEPSPEAPVSPKSPEPVSVDFAFMLERYENLVRENTLLKQEIEDLKNDGGRPVPANPYPVVASPLIPAMAAEPKIEYEPIT
jgi:hypothetical protein